MIIFAQKPWLNPFWINVSFSIFERIVFRRFFVVKYRKRHFPGVYCPKQNVGQMAIFGPKPFEKTSIFRLSEPFVFIA